MARRCSCVGTTFISKQGITSSTFKTVPDVPVGTFELTLPQGQFSALTANGNLCKEQPGDADGIRGAERRGAAPEHEDRGPTGCAKAKKTTHKKERKAKGRKGAGGHRRRKG